MHVNIIPNDELSTRPRSDIEHALLIVLRNISGNGSAPDVRFLYFEALKYALVLCEAPPFDVP